MAQVLKDEQRMKIINSAKCEFYKNGIYNSSMRVIAKNANTTVGNIYRYFKNKQDIVDWILTPINTKLGGLNELLFANFVELNKKMLYSILMNWVDNLVQIQKDFPMEMYIIVNDEDINQSYHKRLYSLAVSIISHSKTEFDGNEQAIEIMAKMIANSVFAGIKEGVSLKCNSDLDTEDFRKIMKQYMKTIFYMFENISTQEM